MQLNAVQQSLKNEDEFRRVLNYYLANNVKNTLIIDQLPPTFLNLSNILRKDAEAVEKLAQEQGLNAQFNYKKPKRSKTGIISALHPNKDTLKDFSRIIIIGEYQNLERYGSLDFVQHMNPRPVVEFIHLTSPFFDQNSHVGFSIFRDQKAKEHKGVTLRN